MCEDICAAGVGLKLQNMRPAVLVDTITNSEPIRDLHSGPETDTLRQHNGNKLSTTTRVRDKGHVAHFQICKLTF